MFCLQKIVNVLMFYEPDWWPLVHILIFCFFFMSCWNVAGNVRDETFFFLLFICLN